MKKRAPLRVAAKRIFALGADSMTQTPLANRFADYAGRLGFDDLPAAAVHEVKRRFIDSIATAVGAMSVRAPVHGDQGFRLKATTVSGWMTTTCSGRWRPGQQGCGRA
jgi:2-methylcitrate dehydratase PrpD